MNGVQVKAAHRSVLLRLACIGALAVMSGCGKKEPAAKIQLPPDLVASQQELEKSKTHLDGTLAALDKVVAEADKDLKGAYDAFVKELSALEAQDAALRARGEAIRAKGAAYFKSWEEQLKKIATPDIQKAAEARKDELSKEYEAIKDSMGKARESADQVMAFLKDVRKILENDLNPSGAKALAPKIAALKEPANALKKQIDGLSAALGKVAAIYSPGK